MVEVTAKPPELVETERLDMWREYLRRVIEVPESVLSGGYDVLLTYLKGLLH